MTANIPPEAASGGNPIEELSLHGEWCRPSVPGRPALVFLHDGLGCVESWRGFPGLLADSLGLGAFAYDRSGYGRSDGPTSFPVDFMDREANMLGRVLRVAGIEDCFLIGHSDGGTVGLLHAALRPGGIRAAVIMSAHVHGDPVASAQVDRHARLTADGDIPGWMYRFHGDRAPDLLTGWTSHWRSAFDRG